MIELASGGGCWQAKAASPSMPRVSPPSGWDWDLWLAIAPTAVATYFGPKNYATNCGIVFSAYGIGAILVSLTAGFAKDIFGSYTRAFHVSGSLATVGVIIALTSYSAGFTPLCLPAVAQSGGAGSAR